MAPGNWFRLAERLERGEVIYCPTCPFPLPSGEEHAVLLQQRLAGRAHKNISFDPHTGKVSGFARQSADQAARLQALLAEFSRQATAWLASILPGYAQGWRLDRVSYRPEEEATRRLRLTARNDLLHLDAFPSRPTNGWRILRLFVNINPTEPRVWVTSEPFAVLFTRFHREVGLPVASGIELFQRLLKWVQPARWQRSPYDAFMLRFHNYLKRNEQFQERGPKKLWKFPPGACWLAMTDTASHAVLRGRYALEHSYFVSPATLVLPAESPAAILERACQAVMLKQAA